MEENTLIIPVKFKKGDKAFVVGTNYEKKIVNVSCVEIDGHEVLNLQTYDKDGKKIVAEPEIFYGFMHNGQPNKANEKFLFSTRAEAIKFAFSSLPKMKEQFEVEKKRSAEYAANLEKDYEELKKSTESLMEVPEKPEEEEKPNLPEEEMKNQAGEVIPGTEEVPGEKPVEENKEVTN